MISKILKIKQCMIHKCKNTSTSVYGKNPFCRQHVHSLCELNTQNNIFNEIRCNSTVPMISLNKKLYCNSHYRTLIYKCNKKKCKKYRNSSELCYDKKWYCKKHKLKKKTFFKEMLDIFHEKLPYDIIEKITKIHLKNNTYVI